MAQTEDPEPRQEQDLGIDLESGLIDVRDDEEAEQPLPDASDRFLGSIGNSDLDNIVDEFVDVMNARDLDGLEDLLAPEAEAAFLGEFSESGVLDGFNDLFLRYPTLLVTRGDIGVEPIVVAWLFHQAADRFDPVGYFSFEVSDTEETQILRVEYGEELPDSEDVVVETPERSDLPEWDDWSELDED